MKKEYQIKLYNHEGFCHNVYIICENIEKTHFSFVKADGISIDFILEVGEIKIME